MRSETHLYRRLFLQAYEKYEPHHSPSFMQSRILTVPSGGPAGAVYGFIFVWIGVASTFAVLSELASMYQSLEFNWFKTKAKRSPGLPPQAGNITGAQCWLQGPQ